MSGLTKLKMELVKELDPRSEECLDRLGYRVLEDGRTFFDRTYLGQYAKEIWSKLVRC